MHKHTHKRLLPPAYFPVSIYLLYGFDPIALPGYQ